MDSVQTDRPARHPVLTGLLAAALTLFLGALLTDWAYTATSEVQWINFAAWLGAAALLLAGLALAWATTDYFRADKMRSRQAVRFPLALLATFVLGFVNALIHAKDAWATMPTGLILSIVVLLLAVASTWLGFAAPQRRGAS